MKRTRLTTPVILAAGLGAPAAAQECQWVNADASGPPLRLDTSLAYDTSRHRLVLFGGRGLNNNVFGDTWEWDGAAWALVSTTGPAPRRGAGLAYDKARQVTVLYSGLGSDPFIDTWEWNGVTWTDVSSGHAGVRISPVMAFEPTRARIVVYGGEGFTLGTASEWTGSTWSEFATGGPIDSRWRGTLDAASNRILIIPQNGSATYALSGTTWQLAGSGTNAYLFGFDTVRGRVFAIEPNNSVQEWTGSGWTILTDLIPGSSTGVFGRICAAAYDEQIHRGIALRSTQTWIWNGSGTRPLMIVTQPPQTQILNIGDNASFTVAVNVPPPLAYQWHRGTTPLQDDGRIAGSQTSHLTIANITAADYSAYTVFITDVCGTKAATSGIEPPATGTCYPNCDHSTVFPYLNANDFQCFIGAYAAGDGFANCDGSTSPPLLNANDFQCFLNKFAAGCSAP